MNLCKNKSRIYKNSQIKIFALLNAKTNQILIILNSTIIYVLFLHFAALYKNHNNFAAAHHIGE